MPAPATSYIDIDGKTNTLEKLRGKPVLLHAWASWCTPCIAEFPELIALAKLDGDITILAITVDQDVWNAKNFLKRATANGPLPANMIVAHDPERKVTQDIYQIYRYPETVLIDADLMLRDKIVGPASWTDDAMIARVNALKRTGP